MSPLEALAICLAGIAAGGINAIVGSGTLITFPTLVAFGVPPVVANVSNNIGLVPGSMAGTWGYRRELAGQRGRVVRLLTASFLGGVAGAVLLLVLPESAFATIVPVLILLGVVLVLLQPRLSAYVARRRAAESDRPHADPWWVWPMVLATGVYGGYFGAAQGVLLIACLGIGISETLQRLNAVKNILAAMVNAVAGIVFVLVAEVDWLIVALIAGGAIVGGLLGASFGRRLHPAVLRGVIAVVGLVAFVSMLPW